MPRIMIVDDDVTIQLELEEYLKHLNHDVVGIADTGLAAVEMARDLNPDLILMDVVMAGEIDGISAAQKIKGETAAAVVFITGFDDPEYIERAKAVEPFGYVMKPFDEKEIRGVIEIVLGRRNLELRLKSANDRLERANFDLQLEIEDRKNTEEALAESERQYKALYGTMRLMCDNAPDMIWAKDLEGRFLFANETMCRNRLMAKDTDEPIGKTESYFIHREQQKRLGDPQWHTLGESHKDSAEIVLKSKQPGKFQETGYVKGKFVHLDVRKAPFLDEDGCIIGTVGCGRDITKEKALEAEHDTLLARVKETAESYRDLVENINDVIFSADENGRVTYVSPRVKTFMGYDPSEIMGKSFTEFVHPDDLPFLLGRFQEIEKGILRPSEYRLRAKSGKYHWVRSSTRPIFNGDHFTGLKGLFIDITEERQLKESLLQIQKMEAISTLTGGIAHDYNNLMAVILGNLSLATEQVEPGSHLADFLTEANTASYKVRDLTHELMALSRGGEPVKEVGSLKELLKSSLDTIHVDNTVSVKESIPQDLWQVPRDPYKMGAVFRNVLTNAVEAMPDGGILTIKAENLRIGDKNRYPDLPLNPGDYVHIAIEDQGKGIPEEHLEKIFDPYFSTKPKGVQKGMGLGLTTSYAIVKKHGGHLALDSTPHVGTTVNIYLPATAAESIAPDAQRDRAEVQSSIANQQSSIQRVMVMDDEEMLRNLTEQMLKKLGYAVETVKDGVEAIETYEKQMDSDKPFDAVILDLTIKGGMGGEQTIAELLKIDPDVKAIVCSGYFNDPVLANHAEYGFQAAMAKPYQKNDLKRVLKEVLG